MSPRLLSNEQRLLACRGFTVIMMGAALSVAATAQTTNSAGTPPEPGGAAVFTAKVPGPAIANVMYFGTEAGLDAKVVKGAPYSATVTTTLTQTLADGNHIVQKQESQFARDSAGRTRREESMNAIGPWSTANSSSIVFINDPVAQVHYVLEPDGKTAMKMSIPSGSIGRQAGMALMPPMGDKKTFYMVGQGGQGVAHAAMAAPAAPALDATLATGPSTTISMTSTMVADRAEAGFAMAGLAEPGADEKTEKLADQTIEGVVAKGTRTTATIPAGTIGNEQPIQIVAETWYSPDLQTVVLSKRNDPRIGESVMSLTNLQRVEPSASLFQVPSSYTVKDGAMRMRTLQPPPEPPQ